MAMSQCVHWKNAHRMATHCGTQTCSVAAYSFVTRVVRELSLHDACNSRSLSTVSSPLQSLTALQTDNADILFYTRQSRQIPVRSTLRIDLTNLLHPGMNGELKDLKLCKHYVDVVRSTDYETLSAQVTLCHRHHLHDRNANFCSKNEPICNRDDATSQETEETLLIDRGLDLYEMQFPTELGHVLRRLQESDKLNNVTLHVTCNIPERYCGVDITCADSGCVQIDSITEATCRIKTGLMGSVRLGKIRGGNVNIESASGNISADLLQANGKVFSSGGDIHLKRVQGAAFEIHSHGGNVSLGPSFAGEMVIDSGVGNVKFASLNASISAVINTTHGNIESGLLDGNSTIRSETGNICILNVAESAARIDAETRDGKIKVTCPSQCNSSFECISNDKIILDNDIHLENKRFEMNSGQKSMSGTIVATDELGGWQGRVGATEFREDGTRKLKTVKLSLRAGGCIEIKRGSWLSSLNLSVASGLVDIK